MVVVANTGSIDGSGPGGIEAGSAHGLTNQVEDEDKKEDEKGSDEEMRRAEEMREVKMPMVQAHDTHTNVIMASAISEVPPPSNPTVFIGRHVYHSSGGAFFFPPLSHTHTVQRRNFFLSKWC
ncbi:hypothetical protein MRB53_030054 [Persea americana]|uniref:Uncharacterized protein n=1 Tax=Persea americana TaxID=3435 RepID=A0ACC2KK58_PERAE|nr:hypothetical protein MRB53_030054 [Persea americana]